MKRAIAFALALTGIALAAWLLVPRGDEIPPGESREAKDSPGGTEERIAPRKQDEPAAVAPAKPSATRTAPAATFVMPDKDLPLRETFAELDTAARSGRAEAACRLAFELMACSISNSFTRMSAALEDELREIEAMPLEDDQKRERLEQTRARHAQIDSLRARCDLRDAPTLPGASRYLAIAGRAGHVAAQRHYLAPNGLRTADLLRDPSLAAEYRATAPRFFRERLEAGDRELLQFWQFTLDAPGETALDAVLPDEWRRPGLLVALRHEINAAAGLEVEPPNAARIRGYEPSEADRADARRLYEAHFRDAPRESKMPIDLRNLMGIGGEIAASCDELAGR